MFVAICVIRGWRRSPTLCGRATHSGRSAPGSPRPGRPGSSPGSPPPGWWREPGSLPPPVASRLIPRVGNIPYQVWLTVKVDGKEKELQLFTSPMALKREVQGKVVKVAGEKTVTILVERKVMHPRYHKIVKRFKKYLVHDENNETGAGDTVKAIECKPISKNKSFTLTEVVEKGVEL